MRVRSPVLWLRQQQSGKLRFANREKVKLVDPHLNWGEITPRRTQRRPRAVIGGAPIIRPPHYGFPTTGQPLPLSVDINSPRGRMGRQTAYKFSAP